MTSFAKVAATMTTAESKFHEAVDTNNVLLPSFTEKKFFLLDLIFKWEKGNLVFTSWFCTSEQPGLISCRPLGITKCISSSHHILLLLLLATQAANYSSHSGVTVRKWIFILNFFLFPSEDLWEMGPLEFKSL